MLAIFIAESERTLVGKLKPLLVALKQHKLISTHNREAASHGTDTMLPVEIVAAIAPRGRGDLTIHFIPHSTSLARINSLPHYFLIFRIISICQLYQFGYKIGIKKVFRYTGA